MKVEFFLDYLVAQQHLNPTQKGQIIQQLQISQKPLSHLLIQERFLSPEVLRQCIQEFQKIPTPAKNFQPPSPPPPQNLLAPILETEEHAEETGAPTKPFQTGDSLPIFDELESLSRSTKKIKIPMPSPSQSAPPSKQETEEDQGEEDEATIAFKNHPQQQNLGTQSRLEELNLLQEKKFEQDRYTSIEILGQGGMGVVELVRDQILGREVALKKIKMEESSLQNLGTKQQMMLWRFHREAEITALLEHPNIVPLYDLQRKHSGQFYFTMRKVEGKTLSEILREKREHTSNSYDENKLLSIFLKVCDALSYAHSRSVIHRDLKPDNIMVGKFGEVYVMDWGIAKKLAEKDEFQENFPTLKSSPEEYYKTIGGMGTPGYMAPEQAENAGTAKIQSDIFSLGIMLRQCYVLYSPMEELKRQRALLKAKSEVKDMASKKQVPSDIQAIFDKATQQQWSKRYLSVEDMASDIERYQNNARVSVREYRFFEIIWKWVSRNWKSVLVATTIFLMFVGFISYLQWYQYQEKQERLQEKRERYNELFKKSQNAETEARATSILGEQIKHLLKSLNYLNLVLSQNQEDPDAERNKFRISQELVRLACQTEDYQLADYLAFDLESLRSLPKQEIEALKTQIEINKNQITLEHLARLDYWINRLQKENLEKDIQDMAIFEISKMPEKEIFQRLLQILEESNTYFLGQERTLLKNEYYKVMIAALGHLGNEEAAKPILNTLTQLSQKYGKLPKNPETESAFMVTLSYALLHSKAKGIEKEYYQLRKVMGMNGLFWKQTRSIYREILLINQKTEEENDIENDTNETPVSKNQNEHIQALLRKAKDLYYLNDYQAAENIYTQALQLSYHPAILEERGKTRAVQNNISGALEDFNSAIQMGYHSPNIYKERARIKSSQKDFQGAIQDYNETIRLDPNFARAYGERGQSKFFLGNMTGALEDINKSIELEPQRYLNYIYRGDLKKAQQNFQGALEDYSEAIRLAPNESDGYFLRGVLKVMLRQYDEAIEDLNIVIQYRKEYYPAYHQRGVAKAEKGNLQESLLDLLEAHRIQPMDPAPVHTLAVCYQKLGQRDESLLVLENFLKKQKHPQIVELWGELLTRQATQFYREKNLKEAKESLLRLVKYSSEKSPKYLQAQKMLQEIEKALQESSK